jgi:hypothetical protein
MPGPRYMVCSCGRFCEDGYRRCPTCRDEAAKIRRRIDAERLAVVIPRSRPASAMQPSRSTVPEVPLSEGAKRHRRLTLEDVRLAWLVSPNNGVFTAWLVAELKKVGGA